MLELNIHSTDVTYALMMMSLLANQLFAAIRHVQFNLCKLSLVKCECVCYVKASGQNSLYKRAISHFMSYWCVVSSLAG